MLRLNCFALSFSLAPILLCPSSAHSQTNPAQGPLCFCPVESKTSISNANRIGSLLELIWLRSIRLWEKKIRRRSNSLPSLVSLRKRKRHWPPSRLKRNKIWKRRQKSPGDISERIINDNCGQGLVAVSTDRQWRF